MLKNKKGFSLLEMLIVIAVVAVLTSIIIPVVSGSRVKSAAATNAANLRGVSGAVTSGKLLGDFTIDDGVHTYYPEDEVLEVMGGIPAPNAEECFKVAKDTEMWVQIQEDGSAYCSYQGYDVNYFAYIAEHGVEPGESDWGMTDSNKLLNQTLDYANKLNTLSKELNPDLKKALKDWAGIDIDGLAKEAGDLAMNVNGQFNNEQAKELADEMTQVNEFLDKYEVCKCEKGGISCSPLWGCGHSHSKGYCGQLKSKS